MSPVRTFMIGPFLLHYGAPKTDAKKEFFAEYDRLLGGNDSDLIREAADMLIKKRTFHNWPTVGECQQAIEAVAVKKATARRMSEFSKGTPQRAERPTDESKSRVDALIQQAKVALAKVEHNKSALPPMYWKRGQKPAWEERMATSTVARTLSLPKEVREAMEVEESKGRAKQ